MNSKEMNSKEMANKEMANKEDQNRERDERAARRSLLREAAEDNSAAESKKPRLDLLDMLSSSTTSVLDILTASGREPLATPAEDQITKETTETESRPGVLDIFDALPKDALAEDKEAAVVEVVMEVEASEEDFMEVLEDYYSKKDEAATIEEILAIATSGAEEVSSDGGLGLHTADESFLGFDADAHQAPLAAEDTTSSTRSRRVYLSPALVWLEEEGLPMAEGKARAMKKAIGVEMDEDKVMRNALLKWKMMGLEEKAIWRKMAILRKKAEENADKKI